MDNWVRRWRIPSRLLGRLGSRCWASTIGAGKSAGKVLTKIERASTPPAEEPTTTRSPVPEDTFSMSLIGHPLPLILLAIHNCPQCAHLAGNLVYIKRRIHAPATLNYMPVAHVCQAF